MSKPAAAAEYLPAAVDRALKDLGVNLALARQRRKESHRTWASRLSVSVPTLIRMEKGDPAVGMGVYATALWLMAGTRLWPKWPRPSTISTHWNRTSRPFANAAAACRASQRKRCERGTLLPQRCQYPPPILPVTHPLWLRTTRKSDEASD